MISGDHTANIDMPTFFSSSAQVSPVSHIPSWYNSSRIWFASQSLSHPVKIVLASRTCFGALRIRRKKATREKFEIYGQRKASRNLFLTESKSSSVALRGRVACFAQSKPSLVVAGQLAVSRTSCERWLVLLKLLFRRCRLLRRLVEAK